MRWSGTNQAVCEIFVFRHADRMPVSWEKEGGL